ncbi:MAG: peptide chain release factor 2 [Gammaproteobacteria bacterium]
MYDINYNDLLEELSVKQQQLLHLVDFNKKSFMLEQIKSQLADPNVWDDQEKIKLLSKEKRQLEQQLFPIEQFSKNLLDAQELFLMAKNLQDENSLQEICEEILELQTVFHKLEFECMFCEELDSNNTFLDIQSGSGGTEAQDWAEILLRMYLRWAESRKFKVEIMETSNGDVAGIKSATIKISGNYAYGWLRTETGVHRLVRKSPFDSGNRRHTSFAAVFVYPEVDDDVNIQINPADLRIDTYRAGGAGGQHVNRTDSAVRITHVPTGIVVQCQSDRSQHKNKSYAMKQLKSKLYDLKMQEKNREKQKLEDSKTDIGWGNQIRSYVLDQSRIKDLRTNLEIFNTQQVLDGGIDPFLEANLKTKK